MILVFDTETTGKADFKRPPEHECQPRLVQLGAILYDKDFNTMAEMNLLVKPEGFTIPKEASSIHGITNEKATAYGMNEKAVLRLFIGLLTRAQILVAHNIQFDGIVIGRALSVNQIEQLPTSRTYCTMKAMTPVCKLPGPYGDKWPSLQEAHKHCTGKEFDGAHDAMADVRACATVLKWLVDKGQYKI